MSSIYDYYITPEEYDIAEKNGICRSTLEYRIRDAKWPKELAITKRPQKIAEWHKVKEIALKNGICRNTFEDRRKRGWNLIDAMTKPPMSRSEALKRANHFNKNNRVLTDEQIQQARNNGLKRSTVYYRFKKLKWDIKESITSPILSASERGRRGKEASYWSRMVIPSKEDRKAKIKTSYCTNLMINIP
ncbi:hypothetical protein OCF62_07425 [Bacillus wiedmannii]|uniref:hypothetical protein n=1 Tax=Bacillus wiedmannii TaxID=1890302 RepID=UPI0021CEC6CC|nr:hypothetical protein [Bacillus wiedmannii]MCU5514400.1 hypothetical protein [Bacillus wiedmannii]